MGEQEIVYTALDNLRRQTGIEGIWEPDNKVLDGKVTLHLENHEVNYHIEVKKELRNHHLPYIENLNRDYPPVLVVARRLFPKIKEELRHQNIAYLEGNGNVFLKYNGSLLWIDANPPLPAEPESRSRAFTKTGLKVLFQFLLDETWINKPYRQIAERTGTTIGNITHIMRGLKEEGFLLAIAQNEYALNNKKELLSAWVVAYEQRLKPTLRIGTFRFLKNDDFDHWKDLSLQPGKTWWGGEAAGDLMTHYLKPAELTLYTRETRTELIQNYRLVPDEKGFIKVYDVFWQQDNRGQTVPALLAYADLMNVGDRRCIETAQKIYDEYLQNQL